MTPALSSFASGLGSSLLAALPFAVAALAAASSPRKHRMSQKEWGLLRRISTLGTGTAPFEDDLRACLEEIMSALEVQAAGIRLTAAPDAPTLTLYRGFEEDLRAKIGSAQLECVAERHLLQHKPILLDELSRCEAHDLSQALASAGLSFFALVPLCFGQRLVGTLVLASRNPANAEILPSEHFRALVDVLALAIAGARQREQADKLAEDLIALHEVNKIISQSLHLDEIIRRIVIEGRRLVKTRQCHLFLVDDRQQLLVGAASTQDDLHIQDIGIKMAEDSLAIRALLQKRLIAVESIARSDSSGARILDWRSAIFAPLITKEQAIGVLICSDETIERTFTQEEISRAETLAHQAAIALENARLFQTVSRSQKEWETTFDAMQDCVSVHDTSGKIFRANAALARRLKTTPQKMIGKYCAEIYNPAQLSFSPCRHMDTLQSESLLVEELELAAMGGTFQLSISPWYDKNNRLAGAIHVAKDVSNEKLLRQQLIQSEKLSAIGELISGIAHELNNPLTGVMGYAQLLERRKDLDERSKESALKINNLALRCQKIVQNLLSFARKEKPERSLSNINDILERTVELRNYDLSVNNITIVRELDRNLPKTIADRHQLQQVFLNVITNAEHAMLHSHGRGCLVIRSYVDRPNNHIAVEIADDGPGISETNLSKIFDPFFTTKEVGKGTGLGLSLSYGIIKEHGGNIYAISRPGEGATFVIELPIISKIADDAAIFPELLPHAPQFEQLIRNKRILIVDDEQYILEFFVEIFRPYPMKADTAGNGKAAMEMLIRNEYDLVITDFKMPQMGGRELFEWIKEKRPHLAKRIIFVTGDTVSTETRSFFEQYCNLYLAKPFKIEEVKEVIQQTLENNER
jgi:two-component system, NtrC family, sensor kinase